MVNVSYDVMQGIYEQICVQGLYPVLWEWGRVPCNWENSVILVQFGKS